ncbi:hypothetical protein Ocin01_00555 [Orchesella cincta]|uniref:Uncharacterized protein n=1 Tax=Orchesella cincta TaxID=48709 RepID=A0A1D2NLE4_ORCCI|nr:hypothetical protein Ocin01_00555 [Orchesella cincta]
MGDTSFESSEEDSEEDSDEDENADVEDEEITPTQVETPEERPVILEETKIIHLVQEHNFGNPETTKVNETLMPVTNEPIHVAAPLPVRQKDEPDYFSPEESEDTLLIILQNAVKETYMAFKGNAARKKKDDLQDLEDSLKGQIQNLDIDLNAKILSLDTNTNSRISTLTEQIVSQRKEDILTFSDNLNQLSKANQVHLETLHAESQHMKVIVEGLNKGQASLSAKVYRNMGHTQHQPLGAFYSVGIKLQNTIDKILMRPLAAQDLSPELPMGCCCSASKVLPQPDKNRDRGSSSRSRSKRNSRNSRSARNKELTDAFAPSLLETSNIDESKVTRKYYFGGSANKLKGVLQQSSSEIGLAGYAQDFRKYNEEIYVRAKKTKSSVAKSDKNRNEQRQAPSVKPGDKVKLPKLKGFDILQPNTIQGQSIKVGVMEQKSMRLQKQPEEKTPFAENNNEDDQEQDYKKFNSAKAESSDEYTDYSSTEGQPETKERVKTAKRRGNNRRTDYERPSTSNRKRSQSRDDNMNSDPRRSRRKSKKRTSYRKSKANEQRILDTYLAQPKVLIVPITRKVTRKSSVNLHGRPTRRILKNKPPRGSDSQKNLPMLRMSGIGSSNIRFSRNIEVRTFNTNSSGSVRPTSRESSSRRNYEDTYDRYTASARNNNNEMGTQATEERDRLLTARGRRPSSRSRSTRPRSRSKIYYD